jgi:hypothetical protein
LIKKTGHFKKLTQYHEEFKKDKREEGDHVRKDKTPNDTFNYHDVI